MEEGLVSANDVELGFVRNGRGPRSIVLIHGWPQTSYAWRRVQPLLATDTTAIALDLRGVGRSSPATVGFDKATMAEDVHAAIRGLRVTGRPVLVGHGIGGMVAYALARRHPADLSGLVLVETPLPGLPGWQEAAASPAAWHLSFHRDRAGTCGAPLAESLVLGRQEVYFRSFIDRFAAHPDAITAHDLDVYVHGYREREQLAAGFEMFRALPLDSEDNRACRDTLTVPVLTVFGEYGFGTLADPLTRGLREAGVRNVSSALIEDCGHWPAEEQPHTLARLITEFGARVWGARSPRPAARMP